MITGIWGLMSTRALAQDFSTSASMHHMSMRGPESLFDYFIIIGGTLTVILVGIYTVKLFINPREQGADHIKRRVLRDDF